MRRNFVNVLVIILGFAIQNCIFPFIPFLSAAPNIITILVFTLGFIHGKKEGIIFGILAGILMDLFYSVPLGFFTLLYLWIGYINGILSKYFYEDYIVLPLLMCAFNEIIYNLYIYIFRFMIRGKIDILFYLKSMIIPEMIITLLFTILMYRLILIYNRKLDEIDSRRGQKIA